MTTHNMLTMQSQGRRLLIIPSVRLICKGAISKLGKPDIRPICGSKNKSNFKMKCFRVCRLRLTRLVKLKNGIRKDSLKTKN